MSIQLFDRLPLEGIRRTTDGYLTATVAVARTGIQEYAGSEIDPTNAHGLRDKAIVRVYRSPEEVFKDSALHSFAHRPVTNDHPPVLVDATNWKQYAVGQTGDEVDASDGKKVRVPMCVMDQGTIDDIDGGKKELSMGYQTVIDFQSGTSPEGEAYDVSQKDMRMNHLAVVRRARGGSELKIGDHQKGEPTMELKTITLDGLPVTTTDAGIAAIDKLKAMLADAAAGHTTVVDGLNAQITKLNQKLATADAALEAANGQVLDAAAMDAAVAARAELVRQAAAIAPEVAATGLSDAALRKAVVTKVLGDAAVAGKPDSYLDARFDILAEEAAAGGALDRALGDSATRTPVNDAAAADAALAAANSGHNAWRQTA